ncbi:MAG: pyruvate formate lyase family protein, partial [Clostridiales bacterium]
HAPQNYWQALQMYWFVHLTVITELNTWDSFCPGHLDQHLFPFYERDCQKGILDRDQARELMQCFFIKCNNQPAPPKVGVTAEESGTYTDFCNINNGGLKKDGSDGVNEISYLIMDVIEDLHLLQPSSNLQLSRKTPDKYLKRVAEVIRQGWGFPSIFNADAVIEELVRQGKDIEDAREGGTSGCVEAGAFGKEAYWLTGYFNLPKILEITLNNGFDPQTKKQIGLQTGEISRFADFDSLFAAWEKQIAYFLEIKIKGNAIIERLFATLMPSPFLSTVIDDCIAKGMDYNGGGPRYNTSYIQGVGLGSITDCFSALKYHIFDMNNYTLEELSAALKNDFRGYEDMQRELTFKTPKYGNDDDYAEN